MRMFGFPLPVILKGSFANLELFRWSGLMVDLLVLFGFAAATFWALNKFSARKRGLTVQ